MSDEVDAAPSSKVVPLFSGDIPLGTPDPVLVERLERLLEAAKRGDIHGMAACYELSSGHVQTMIHTNDNRFAMSHAISALWFRFQTVMAEEAFTSDEGV